MTDILTNGPEIKKRIISEIKRANQNIYIAMAYFTDKDIANELINSFNNNTNIEVILSSSNENEDIKKILSEKGIAVHAFETGDTRGMMHHKFCLIDNKISITGSYNYTYNASSNNIENIQVSDDSYIYRQYLAEFERLKYNIENKINVNINTTNPIKQVISEKNAPQSMNQQESFSQQLSNLVYTTAKIDTENYKNEGYQDSKNSSGHVQVFATKYRQIKGKIASFATDDTINSVKSIIKQNVDAAYESKKDELDHNKINEITSVQSKYEIELRQIKSNITELKEKKFTLEAGNEQTGEQGLLQINNKISQNISEKESLESSFLIQPFWSAGTVVKLMALSVLTFFLCVFFASAFYKVFFESNEIQRLAQAGVELPVPQILDANAIIKTYTTYGTLYGIVASLFFLIPVLLSNLKLMGSTNKWVNTILFWIGILVFDITVAVIVAMNIEEIKCLRKGIESNMQMWEVVKQGEFWLIFVFGMLPLIITHYVLNAIVSNYKKSQKIYIDKEKNAKIKSIDKSLHELNLQKEVIFKKIEGINDDLKIKNTEFERIEREINIEQNKVKDTYMLIYKNIKAIYDDYIALITSGRIFTDEILERVTAAYTSGYIDYLSELYAPQVVTSRIKEIHDLISNKS